MKSRLVIDELQQSANMSYLVTYYGEGNSANMVQKLKDTGCVAASCPLAVVCICAVSALSVNVLSVFICPGSGALYTVKPLDI